MNYRYGILREGKYTKFKNAKDINSFARILLAYFLKMEGLKMNDVVRRKYMESWCAWSEETDNPTHNPLHLVDTAADTIVYSNIHLIDCKTNVEITREEQAEIYNIIVNLLTESLC